MTIDLFAFATQIARDEFQPRDPLPEIQAPRDCCAEFAAVIVCDDETDLWECPFCGATWTAPCR